MRPELLAKIKKLIEDGAVVLGPAPKRSPSGESFPVADRQVKKLADELWSGPDGRSVKAVKRGKGELLFGMTMEEALEAYRLCAGLRIAGRCSGSLWTSFCRRCRYLFYLNQKRQDD